ncbi:hypothetical protein PN36_31115 [Candidatus Thiomargarita nelsonii]|uniref:Secreted protein n=1 Tax=Candidatus Thiomargarita nelsonii TaxID=1003181 RepID=A0A4E0QL63_9GAMM|nr:hypothetical protein PN36_31115 [Candidatus Thiomargarita nelsonii]
MMRQLLIALVCFFLLSACAPPKKDGPSVAHGFSSALAGVGHLLLSPFQIATGLLEGIASVNATNAPGQPQGIAPTEDRILCFRGKSFRAAKTFASEGNPLWLPWGVGGIEPWAKVTHPHEGINEKSP